MSQSSSPVSMTSQACLPTDEDYLPPTTPVRTQHLTRRLLSPRSTNKPEQQVTIRERRGRRHFRDGNFHPLSVFTKSALFPFALDTDKALEILKSDSPDRLEAAKKAINNQDKKTKAVNIDLPTTPPSSRYSSASIDMIDMLNTTRTNDIDLITALRTTSPEKDLVTDIHADFDTLCQLPIPEALQHPAFSSDPFEVKTEIPRLFTTTPTEEIRRYNTKSRRQSQARYSYKSVDRKPSLFGVDFKSPASLRSSKNAFAIEEPPWQNCVPTPSTSTTTGSFGRASPLALEFLAQKDGATTQSSNSSVRKFSDLFRRKESLEKSPETPAPSPRTSREPPRLDRFDLERHLRVVTNSPTYDHDLFSSYPRHPATGRGWKSRNLKCTTCPTDPCAVCHRVCCAFKAAVLALDNHSEGSTGRHLAVQRIQEITKIFPYGKEAPTFIQCTHSSQDDGQSTGCGKMVCPDCSSICSECGDTQCRKCKPAMWEECDWHKSFDFGDFQLTIRA